MTSIFAYIDPGVGLLAWQAIVAAVLGLLFYVRKTRAFVFGLVMKPFRRGKGSPALPEKVETELEETGR